MPKLDRGMVIADRYVVSDVVRPWFADHPAVGSVCVGLDAILDQPVLLYLADSEAVAGLLDAGRRASLLTDPRIPAVHDVGSSQGFDFVVCERAGGTPLPRALAHGPLSPAAATALVGELATALAHAAKRGLHHLFLGPESVLITDDNDVVVHGLAIDAAAADRPYGLRLDELSAQEAQRTDALALIDILYACLTGTWPGSQERAGLPASGMKNSRIVPARSLAEGIPGELEQFVSGVVAQTEPGPRSASEIVRYLGEWDVSALGSIDRRASQSRDELSAGSAGTIAQSVRPSAPLAPVTAAPQARPGDNEGSSSSGRRASPAQMQAALARIGMTRPGVHGAAAGVSDATRSPYDDRMKMRSASRFPIAPASLDSASQRAHEWQPEDSREDYSAYAAYERDDNLTAPILDREALWDRDAPWGREAAGGGPRPEPDDAGRAPGQSAPGPDAAADGAADAPADRPAPVPAEEDEGGWFMGGMFTTREERFAEQQAEYERESRLREAALERARADEERERAAQERARAEQAAAAEQETARRRRALSADERSDLNGDAAHATGLPAGDGGAAPAGANARGAAEHGGRAEHGDAVTAETAGSGAGAAGTTPAGATATGAGAAGTVGRAPAGEGGARPPGRRSRLPVMLGGLAILVGLGIVAALFIRPGADRTAAPEPAETSASAPSETAQGPAPAIASVTAIDPQGDGKEHNADAKKLPDGDGTWSTDRYSSAQFGSLKDGLGLRIKLEESAAVKSVTLDSKLSGGSFDILVGDSAKRGDARRVGSGKFSKADGTLTLDEPAEGSYVFVWITELPKSSTGYRAQLTKVAVG
ncbi:hypothetical protein BRM1_09745 [Brevibacterium sp. BRM-1]|uniref:hypothetical protein n=1 Tax=Brevibacterium sp. BRM-1 TaxID=2999062 RepID=UPI00227E7791|nr:hypothetical protein [Brevibacterium sp. BRM-1]WAL39550.1 hypothetical protein BRM1_09745 [Brevibacterium sp. BRM-1]